MNVLLLTADQPLYLPRYLEPIIRNHKEKLTKIVFTSHPNEDLLIIMRDRYQMFGPKAFIQYGFLFAFGNFMSVILSH